MAGRGALTVKRKGGIFLDKVSAVNLRKNQLEEAFDKLIEHTYELADTDFDPLTAPQVMVEYLNKQMTDLLNKTDLTLAKYEDRIKEAERTKSQKDPLPSLPPAPPATQVEGTSTPPDPTPAMFRPMGIKKKTFEEIPGAIKAIASRFITLHDRRLDFL